MDDLLAGRWALGGALRRDALGDVREARDADGSPAWVRVLPPGLSATPGLAEALAGLPRVAGRHVAPLIATGVTATAGHAAGWLAWSVPEGARPLAAVLAEGLLTGRQAARVAADATWALTAGHAGGVVHGALSAHDVATVAGLRGSTVVGLGVFPLLREAVGAAPPRSAPEVRAGQPPTPASDLWSVGALLRQCVGGSLDDTELSPALLAELHQLLERDPERRPASARLVASHLVAAATGLRSSTRTGVRPRPAASTALRPAEPPPPVVRQKPPAPPVMRQESPAPPVLPAPLPAPPVVLPAPVAPAPAPAPDPLPAPGLRPPGPPRPPRPSRAPRRGPSRRARLTATASALLLFGVGLGLLLRSGDRDAPAATSGALASSPAAASPVPTPVATASGSVPAPVIAAEASTDPVALALVTRAAATAGDVGTGAVRRSVPQGTDFNAFIRPVQDSCDYYTPVGSPRTAHRIVRFDLPGAVEVYDDVTSYPVPAQTVVDGLRTVLQRCRALTVTDGPAAGRYQVLPPLAPTAGLGLTGVELVLLSEQPAAPPVRLVALAQGPFLDVVVVRAPTTTALREPAGRVARAARGRLAAVAGG